MHTARTSWVLLVFCIALPRSAWAQSTSDSRGYGGAGVTLAVQPEESGDGHYLTDSTVGGVSAGAHLVGGLHVSPRLSVCVEFSVPAAVSGERSQLAAGGYTQQAVTHREPVVSALARWHVGSRRWRLEPVGGFSWVLAHTTSTGNFFRFDSMPPTPITSEEDDTRVAMTAGVDVPGLVSERLAIAPFFRVHWVQRAAFPEDTFTALPGVIYRAGVTVMGRW